MNFDNYVLALIKENKIIFSSKDDGLTPLMECIIKFKDYKDCELHDKIIGLAAAKLILYSEMIKEVKTSLISSPAKKLLEENKIKIEAEQEVENILNKDKTDICPMEKKAMSLDKEDLFLDLNL